MHNNHVGNPCLTSYTAEQRENNKRAIISDIDGKSLIADCTEFSQIYSGYCRARAEFKQHASSLPPSPNTAELAEPLQAHPIEIKAFYKLITETKKLMADWRNSNYSDPALRERFESNLVKAEVQVIRAARALAAHYLTLHEDIQKTVKEKAEGQFDLIATLSGLVKDEIPALILNRHEVLLTEAQIDLSTVPEAYCDPITERIMVNPTIVGAANPEGKPSGATHVYDSSTIAQVDRCPISYRPLNTLNKWPDVSLKKEIDQWVKNQIVNKIIVERISPKAF